MVRERVSFVECDGNRIELDKRVESSIDLGDKVIVLFYVNDYEMGDMMVGRNIVALGSDGNELWRVEDHGLRRPAAPDVPGILLRFDGDRLVVRRPGIDAAGFQESLARISRQGHGLRGVVGPTEQERRAARCASTRARARDAVTSGKRLDARCRPESAALRVAPRRPPASSRPSTVGAATLFGPLLADRPPGRDAGRNLEGKYGLEASPPAYAVRKS